MDIKAKITEITNKIKSDKNFAENFKNDPVKAVESVIGIDLPNDQINAIIDGIKANITANDVKEKIGGFLGGLKK